MELALLATLLVLALVDSTSFGTLGIPVWLSLQPRIRTRAIAQYLLTVALFYFAVGLVLYAGALQALEPLGAALRPLAEATDGDARLVAQLALGVGLFALSFKVDPPGRRGRQGRRSDPSSPARSPGRIDRLKARVSGARFDARAAAVLAVGAASIELLMMLPYLAAIGMLADSGSGWVVAVGALTAYVGVMVAPAAGLLALRVVARHRASRVLEAVGGWIDRHSAEALGWALGIGGFLLAAGAVRGLGLVG